jgi:hypothetical protein
MDQVTDRLNVKLGAVDDEAGLGMILPEDIWR